MASDAQEPAKRAEIYTYDATWPIYAMNWSVRKDSQFRLGIGSFLEDYRNMDKVELKSLLNNNKNSEFCAPLTSFDWNELEPKRVGTSSIDTTCTIWDIEKEVVDTQLIAHDKEVNDIAWGGVGVFASVSADGSVRVFDLRDKEHSTIIYESPPDTPLLRLGADLGFVKHEPADRRGLDPILAYTAKAEINQLQWSSSQTDWVAIAFASKLRFFESGEERRAWDFAARPLSPLTGSRMRIIAKLAIAKQKAQMGRRKRPSSWKNKEKKRSHLKE
ncbi:hypothetical protein JRQ81_000021 [Phrynocephalus forsythii]|uniref:Uncharacterized protein n=1 Tax=Phrynocephalus forsythii TaxID=171643 RepID=A0A9Q1APV2_9SAUR|nr:hypothetical protein JRQ81_000021 [Phrynocephalus forsythii]